MANRQVIGSHPDFQQARRKQASNIATIRSQLYYPRKHHHSYVRPAAQNLQALSA